MDNLEFWRETLLECLESEQEFAPKLKRYRVEKFAGIFLGCQLPSDAHAVTTETEAEILRFIFHIVHRASCETPVVSFSPTAAFLIDFAKTYAAANPEAVRSIISNFLTAKPGLESEFICTRASMVDYIKGVIKRLEKSGYDKVAVNHGVFVVKLFANIGLGLSRLFSVSSKVCSWFNLTSDFLTTMMAFYDSVTQLILLFPHLFEANSKRMFISAIHFSLETKYFSPIKSFGTSPATRVSLFDQLYNILTKQGFTEGVETKRALYDASLAADLALLYDYPALLASLNGPDIACRKPRLDSLVELFDSVMFGLERPLSPPPSYHSTTDVESDDEMLLESRISQVQDIFPDLDASFVKLCFEQLAVDAEGLIARLLEDDLPQHLKALRDQPGFEASILATRRNIHDNDAFDLLAPGRKEAPLEGIYHKERSTLTAAIMPPDDLKESTLQLVYNQYEDEYDDTYDQDLHGLAEPDEILQDPSLKHEATLYSAYSDTPDLFQKSKEARNSKGRATLRLATGMSDEQLEGWASMLRREPARQRKLADKHGIAAPPIDNHAQPVSQQPQAARNPPNKAHKDRNKAKFANHHRKDMHQRKLDKA